MKGSIRVPPEDEVLWSRSLGYFIWSMGQIEWLSFEWGRQIGGDALKDRLIDQLGFRKRHDILKSEILRTDWTGERKKRALVLWRRALGFSQFRNVVAHNPVVTNQNYPGSFGIVSARALKGHANRKHRIYFQEFVYRTATRMQALAAELQVFLK